MLLNRRNLFKTAAGLAFTTQALRGAAGATDASPLKPVEAIGYEDHRFADLRRGANARWIGSETSHVVVPLHADAARDAVQWALDRRQKVAARSGGHCYEAFATDGVELSVNMRELRHIEFDEKLGAISVGAGCTLGEAYGTLFRRWGVILPGGTCPTVGMGGHVPGGGYGASSRMHGLIVDHLLGVEVIVVGADGIAKRELALRQDEGPRHDLWWAFTGGGAGQFGLVTRFLFSTQDATATPGDALPRAPSEVLQSSLRWNWDDLNPAGFKAIIRGYAEWLEANADLGPAQRTLFSQLRLQPKSSGGFEMMTQVDPAIRGAEATLSDFERHVQQSSRAIRFTRRLPWLKATTETVAYSISDTTRRFKGKSAYMRRGFDDEQLDMLYRHLSDESFKNPALVVMLTSYGGRINDVASSATATWQRDSIVKINYIVFWDESADDELNIGKLRSLYRDIYQRTGGVPIHGGSSSGCYVGYADTDLQRPDWNSSGYTYKELYWGDNANRLAEIRSAVDPHNIFSHAQVC